MKSKAKILAVIPTDHEITVNISIKSLYKKLLICEKKSCLFVYYLWKLGSIGSISHKGNQSWIFIERTDAEAETPILWPPDVKNWLTGKDPDAGKDWRWEEKGTTEDEMVGWHHQLNGHEFEQVLGVGDGYGSLVCCSPWGCKRVPQDRANELNQ